MPSNKARFRVSSAFSESVNGGSWRHSGAYIYADRASVAQATARLKCYSHSNGYSILPPPLLLAFPSTLTVYTASCLLISACPPFLIQ